MIDGAELLVIAAMVLGVLFLGPSQLPKLARSLGEAKREFSKALSLDSKSSEEKHN